MLWGRGLSPQSFYWFSRTGNLEVMQEAAVCLEDEGTMPLRGAVWYPTSSTKIQTSVALCLRIAGFSGFFWSALEVKVSDTYLVSMVKAVTIVTSKLCNVFLKAPHFLHVFLPAPLKSHRRVFVFLMQKEAALPLVSPVQGPLWVGGHFRSLHTT